MQHCYQLCKGVWIDGLVGGFKRTYEKSWQQAILYIQIHELC